MVRRVVRRLSGVGVYHVDMSRLPGNVSGAGAQGEAVFAVQTGTTAINGLINYVVVASNSRRGATTWTIGYAHGLVADAKLETLARIGPSKSSPVSQQISLVTDGRHRLTVYFGNRLVYSANDLRLDIQPPFQPYLEVQALRIPYASVLPRPVGHEQHDADRRRCSRWLAPQPDRLQWEGRGIGPQPRRAGALAAHRARRSRARSFDGPPERTGRPTRAVQLLRGRRLSTVRTGSRHLVAGYDPASARGTTRRGGASAQTGER